MNALFQTQPQSLRRSSPTPPSALTRRGVLQRKCASCGSHGAPECAECKSKKRLQAQLSIGASHDPLEMEADRVADQVLSAPRHPAVSASRPHIQRSTSQTIANADVAPASVDRVLASAGRPMEPTLQQDMEQRFGYDFSHVRIHADAPAGQSAREVNAHAYTVGRDIVFGAGRFAPATDGGRRLIAHELTHVVQQTGSAARLGEVVRRHGPVFVQRTACESLAPPNCDGGTCEEGKKCVGGDWPVCSCWTIAEIERWRRARQPREGGSGYQGGGGRSGGGGSTDSY